MSDKPSIYPYADISGDPSDTRIAIRASSFGKPMCQLVASACGFEPEPPPEFLRKAFNEGHVLEPIIMHRLERWDWAVSQGDDLTHGTDVDPASGEPQTVAELKGPGFVIRGHIDGIGMRGGTGEPRIIEAKALGPDLFREVKGDRIDDILDGSYATQLSIYMHALKMPATWAVLEKKREADGPNKDEIDPDKHFDHEFWVRDVDDPPISRGDILKRGVEIAKAVNAAGGLGSRDNSTLPACPLTSTGKYPFPCSFHYLHDGEGYGEDGGWGDTEDVATNDALERFGGDKTKRLTWVKLARRYASARDAEANAKLDRENARDELVAMHDEVNSPEMRGLGFKVVTKTRAGSRRTDMKKVAAALGKHGLDIDDFKSEPGKPSRSVEVEEL